MEPGDCLHGDEGAIELFPSGCRRTWVALGVKDPGPLRCAWHTLCSWQCSWRWAVSVTEYERHQVFQWYEEAMGTERAKIMMNLVPPVGWGEVATRTDLAALGSGLRGEMSVLSSELRGEMSVLRSELRAEMSVLSSELRGEMKAANAELLRTLFFAMVASNATLVGLVFAAVRFA